MIERAALPWLATRAARTPEAVAVRFGDACLTYAALAARVECAAGRLHAAGVGPGDRVATLLPNGLACVELLHACAALGAALLPLNLRLTPRELAFQVRDSGARLLVHDTGAGGARAAEVLREAAGGGEPECAGLEVDGRAGVSGEGAVGAFGPVAHRPDDPLSVLYTSGTTGTPKGAVLTAANFHASAVGSAALLGAEPDDVWLACLPLFHVGGISILTRSVVVGSSVLVHPHFDPVAVNRAIDEDGVVLVSLVATMLARVLAERGERPAPAQLRCVLLGGGPTPVPLLRRAAELRFPVAPTYGLTEAASQVATRPPGPHDEPGGGGLRPLAGTALRIVGGDGIVLAAGEVGEIQLRGPTVMREYLGRPEETARALAGGWLRTGDVGWLDTAGSLSVLDRRSDLIVSGGENVYPAEVEQVLLEHPAVLEVAVVGVPYADFGERPVAWWVPRCAEPPEAKALEAFCRERLAGYKVPVEFRAVATLPRNAAGKLLRRELRAERRR